MLRQSLTPARSLVSGVLVSFEPLRVLLYVCFCGVLLETNVETRVGSLVLTKRHQGTVSLFPEPDLSQVFYDTRPQSNRVVTVHCGGQHAMESKGAPLDDRPMIQF